MAEINVRSDSVDVEQIMRQIRARIREKRGADYTEDELQQLASVKLQEFLDPRGVRSDLVAAFRKHRTPSPPLPNYAFEDTTLFDTHRGALRFIRRLLRPALKLFFNPNTLSDALNIQAKVNTEVQRQLAEREALDPLFFEVIHNLVVETTRLGIEVQNLKMRIESMSSRLDFDERRARALETVVEYKPSAERPKSETPSEGDDATSSGTKRRRRRRRRRPTGRTAAETAGAGAAGADAGTPGPDTPGGAESPAGGAPTAETAGAGAAGADAETPEPDAPGGAESPTRNAPATETPGAGAAEADAGTPEPDAPGGAESPTRSAPATETAGAGAAKADAGTPKPDAPGGDQGPAGGATGGSGNEPGEGAPDQ
jgi:hypothetical protein